MKPARWSLYLYIAKLRFFVAGGLPQKGGVKPFLVNPDEERYLSIIWVNGIFYSFEKKRTSFSWKYSSKFTLTNEAGKPYNGFVNRAATFATKRSSLANLSQSCCKVRCFGRLIGPPIFVRCGETRFTFGGVCKFHPACVPVRDLVQLDGKEISFLCMTRAEKCELHHFFIPYRFWHKNGGVSKPTLLQKSIFPSPHFCNKKGLLQERRDLVIFSEPWRRNISFAFWMNDKSKS